MFSGMPTEYQKIKIINDGFWPDLNVAHFQKTRSIPPDIDVDAITGSLTAAIGEINDSLLAIKARYQSTGYLTAADVPGPHIEGGNNLLTEQYFKAIYARAKVELIPEFASLGRRETNAGKESPDTRAGLLAEASYALRNIKGKPRVGVALL